MTKYEETIKVHFAQPRHNENQIEVHESLELWAESGGHRIHLQIPSMLFAYPADNIPSARVPALAAIIKAAEAVLREYFHEPPTIAHSPLPAISWRTFGARPIEASRASLRAFRTSLRTRLGIP